MGNKLTLHHNGDWFLDTTESQGNWKYRDITESLNNIKDITRVNINPHAMCPNACAHCHEDDSYRWFKMQELDAEDLAPRYDDDPEVLNNFWLNAEYLNTVRFDGGDPVLYPKTHVRTLEKMRHPGNINLEYSTSLSRMIDPEVVRSWEKFNSVKLYVSVDVSPKYWSYFRYGSHWENIVENIADIKERSNAEVHAYCTVNILLMMDLYPVIEWFVDNQMRFNYGYIDTENQLSCVYLPTHLKREAALQLSRCKLKTREYKDPEMKEVADKAFDSIQAHMFSQYNDEDEFWWETLKLFSDLDRVYDKNIFRLSDLKIKHVDQVIKPRK